MDPILFWNDVALEANRVSHTDSDKREQNGPTLSSRALAIVHLAMYDAYAGVKNTPATLPPYLPGLPMVAAGASAAAAVAAAAHATLSFLYKKQKPFFDTKHTQAGLSGAGLAAGHEYGLRVARAILEDRKMDPDASDDGYAASMARGAHRPDPDNAVQGFHAPFYGARSKGFAINARHVLATPPQPGTAPYKKALKEVRGKGIAPELMGTLPAGIAARTVDETVIGLFWAYDGASGLGTPPRLYNQIVRTVVANRAVPNTTDENARLFALVNVAMADAGILAWDQKFDHDLWRPVLGIREHDTSMGPVPTAGNNLDNDADPNWLPLGAPNTNGTGKNPTPQFPAYPSGHATFGAAAFHMTRLFYGTLPGDRNVDNLTAGMNFVSEELNGVNRDNKGAVRPNHARNFPGGLWQMILENGRSRVYLGVHWIFDAFAVDNTGAYDSSKNIGGVQLGLKIAEDIFGGAQANGMKKSTVPPKP
jgi:hypothetical protein